MILLLSLSERTLYLRRDEGKRGARKETREQRRIAEKKKASEESSVGNSTRTCRGSLCFVGTAGRSEQAIAETHEPAARVPAHQTPQPSVFKRLGPPHKDAVIGIFANPFSVAPNTAE